MECIVECFHCALGLHGTGTKQELQVRDTLLGCASGPNIDNVHLCRIFDIYHSKPSRFNTHKTNRKSFLEGNLGIFAENDSRWDSSCYGFPEVVREYCRSSYDHDEISTPDTWGRSVWHTPTGGDKDDRAETVIRHMRAVNKEDHHKLFSRLFGEECLTLLRDFLGPTERKFKIRLPGIQYLHSLKPNYCMYFKSTSYGECTVCKPSYHNYRVFRELVHDQDPDINLPESAADWVCSQLCDNTRGSARHNCEDNRCQKCSFYNYFIEDQTVKNSPTFSKFIRSQTFFQIHGINLVMDAQISWHELVDVGPKLAGGRRYSHVVWKECAGTVTEFLSSFQDDMIAFKPHKIYERYQRHRKQFSKKENSLLNSRNAAVYADYSENFKKKVSRSCTAEEWRSLPDASLLNFCTFIKPADEVLRFDYHAISNDPKHDSCLSPKSFEQVFSLLQKRQPTIRHFEVTTDTSAKEFKAVSVFKRMGDISNKLQVSILMSTFGPQHGKFLIDPAGKDWTNEYDKDVVGDLPGIDSQDLYKVAEYMNKEFSLPVKKTAHLSERTTIVTESVKHTLSSWKSLDGTKRHYCYLFLPNKKGFVFQR